MKVRSTRHHVGNSGFILTVYESRHTGPVSCWFKDTGQLLCMVARRVFYHITPSQRLTEENPVIRRAMHDARNAATVRVVSCSTDELYEHFTAEMANIISREIQHKLTGNDDG